MESLGHLANTRLDLTLLSQFMHLEWAIIYGHIRSDDIGPGRSRIQSMMCISIGHLCRPDQILADSDSIFIVTC